MPQDLHVVKCYKCNTYQVDIVKKVKKWTCKMCGEKQSLVKVFGGGSGRDCRELVQHLNARRISEDENSFVEVPEENCPRALQPNDTEEIKMSKWAEFMSKKDEQLSDNLDKSQDDLSIYQTSSLQTRSCEKQSDCEKKNNVYHTKKKRKVQQSGIKSLNQSKTNCSKWSEFLTCTNLNTLDENKSIEELPDNNTTTPQLIYKNSLLCDTKQNIQRINEVKSINVPDPVCINKFGNKNVYSQDNLSIYQTRSSINNNCDKNKNSNVKSQLDCEKKNNEKKRKVQQSGIKSLYQAQSSCSKWSEFLTDTNMYKNLNAVDENKSIEDLTDNATNTQQLIYKKNSLYDTKQNIHQIHKVNSTNVLDTVRVNEFENEDVCKDKFNTIFQSHENDIDSILDF